MKVIHAIGRFISDLQGCYSWNIRPAPVSLRLFPLVLVLFGQPLCLMSPKGERPLWWNSYSTPTLHICRCPPPTHHPLVIFLVYSILSTLDSPTPALYLGLHLWRSLGTRCHTENCILLLNRILVESREGTEG